MMHLDDFTPASCDQARNGLTLTKQYESHMSLFAVRTAASANRGRLHQSSTTDITEMAFLSAISMRLTGKPDFTIFYFCTT